MQKFLVAAAVFCSVVGILLLLALKPSVSPQLVELSGDVIQVSEHGGVTFIELIPDNLTVVSFNGQVHLGKQKLYGQLKQYKGRLEFVLDD